MIEPQKLWIPGPMPGLNDMLAAAGGSGGTRAGWARMKRSWTDTVALLARAARLKPVPSVWLRFTWHERKRNRDPDNIVAARKFVLDGLVTAGVLSDDGWSEVVGFEDRWLHSAVRPGVLVVIESATLPK